MTTLPADRSLHDYVGAVASPAPAPGAGSVTAIIGSLGCALGSMVVGITAPSRNSPDSGPLDEPGLALDRCRHALLRLAPDDEAAYLAFRSAQNMPRVTEDERLARMDVMQSALARAADVPMEIATTCCTALEAMAEVARLGSPYTLADVATGSHALHAAILGAIENVTVNVSMMRDADNAARYREAMRLLRMRADEAMEIVFQALASR